MDAAGVLKEVNDIFIDVLDDEDIELSDSTTSNDIEEWDSLNHIQLVIAIEKHFQLQFTTTDIEGWENVGAMCQAIRVRLENK